MSGATCELEKVSFDQINLPDRSYRWAVRKTFTWDSDGPSDQVLLSALLRHPAYKDHYCAPGEDGVGDEPLHGAYRLDALTTTAYQQVGRHEALRLLDSWLSESGDDDTDPSDAAAVQAALRPVRDVVDTDGAIYYLPDLGQEAQHDWGWVLWFFREWVVIEHPRRLMHLISCGLD